MNTLTHLTATVHASALRTGVFDSANDLIAQTTMTVKSLVMLLAICAVLASMWITKSWKGTAVVAALAVFVVWLVTFDGISFLAGQANEDIQGAAVSPVVAQVLGA